MVKQRTIWRFGIVWFVWRLWVWLRYALTGDCGCACGYVEPYGFVPEAECPIHDRYEMGRPSSSRGGGRFDTGREWWYDGGC